MKKWSRRLLKLKYYYDLKKLKVFLPKKPKDMPAKLRHKKNEGDLALATGLVAKEVAEYIEEHVRWCPIEDKIAKTAEFIIFDDDALNNNYSKIMNYIDKYCKFIPIVIFLKKAPKIKIGLELINSVQKIYLCKGIVVPNIDDFIEKIEVVEPFVDMRINHPINRTKSAGRIGIIIDDYATTQASFESFCQYLEQWARREDLQVIGINKVNLSSISGKPFLVSKITEICDEIDQVNKKSDAILLLNFTEKKLDDFELYSRMSQGQLVVNVSHNESGYIFYDPLTGKAEVLTQYLEGLNKHFSLEKISVHCIRKVANNYSPMKHMRTITQELTPNVKPHGISIVVCTSKPTFINNIIENYSRQSYQDKEMVIVLHSNDIEINKVRESINDSNIRIYQRNPEALSFGYCLNYGFALANKEYIAKFDDDDYYGENYLSDLMVAFSYSNAKVVGKSTFHSYLHESNKFITRKPGLEYQYTNFLPGATFLIKREVLQQTMFRSIPRDIDGRFCFDCKEAGLKMYSTDSFNLLVNRLRNKSIHTWKASDQFILRQSLPATESINVLLGENKAYLDEEDTEFDNAVKAVSV